MLGFSPCNAVLLQRRRARKVPVSADLKLAQNHRSEIDHRSLGDNVRIEAPEMRRTVGLLIAVTSLESIHCRL